MKVGFVGLGKLGLPVAATIASRGHVVLAHDVRPDAMGAPENPGREAGLAETWAKAKGWIHFCALDEVVRGAEVIFVAVQTPHETEFGGTFPLPADRADFDYSHLREACAAIDRIAGDEGLAPTIAVISTVLPGTMDREIIPLLRHCPLAYNPAFIAMGTTVEDFLRPEFVLMGGATEPLEWLYRRLTDAPQVVTTIRNAELTKVAYNTWISMKIAFANTLLEISQKTGCDADTVTDALALGTKRITSAAYMRGGMGDGGACHPRDNIALSWLARELDLSHDLFEDVMLARENQANWLLEVMDQAAPELPKAILGAAYKPGSHLTDGSAALLVRNLAGEPMKVFDPHVPIEDVGVRDFPHCYLIGARHAEFPTMVLPAGSVVVDPFRYMPDREDVAVIRLGEGPA